uniref:Ribosomal protein S27 like n=1 Tax=Gasterosteus aculeatus aculeatus TaxID=481459 RepID=A0AAQ4QSE9_GASAC
MPLARDLLHPSIELQRREHKKKILVQSPNSYFMDVKCPGTASHAAQTVVLCLSSGGKARLTEGCSFRRKQP